MKLQMILFLLPCAIAYAEIGNPKDIPNAGRIRIDGKLNDWRKAEWTPLTQTLHGTPAISNAQWSLQWNDDPSLFIAIRYTDANIVLNDGFITSNAQDCVEIYVRGDDGSQPTDYSALQNSAQHYLFGLSANKTNAWKKLASINPFPAHNPAEVAVTLNGNELVYEIRVPLYDTFDAKSRQNCETTEVMEELEIGIDIAIIDVGSTGYASTITENRMPDKAHNAEAIALHTLGE